MTAVVRSHILETSFGFYNKNEIDNLSVCQICSPVAFDSLGNPLPNGLYDARMGPTSQSSPPCVTCGLVYAHCPGHVGHIELNVPLYHPLLFSQLFALLRTKCWSCHQLRLGKDKVRLFSIKLKLLGMGNTSDALNLECIAINDSDSPENTEKVDFQAKLSEYEERYEKFRNSQMNWTNNSSDIETIRIVVDDFHKTATQVTKCERCGAFSRPLKKEGHTKIFQKALAAKHRNSMRSSQLREQYFEKN